MWWEGQKDFTGVGVFCENTRLSSGKEKAKCSLCNVVIGCFSWNGTSAMMNHLKTICPKSSLRTNLDKLQKTLRFEKVSSKEKFHTVNTHTFNQERLRKKLALMCIKDNQPFRIEPCYQCNIRRSSVNISAIFLCFNILFLSLF